MNCELSILISRATQASEQAREVGLILSAQALSATVEILKQEARQKNIALADTPFSC